MFGEDLEKATEGLDPASLGRVIIHHAKLSSPVYVGLRPIRDMDAKCVMEHVQNVLSSNEDLPLDESFYIDIGTIQVPSGGRGIPIFKLQGEDNSIDTKDSLIHISNKDHLCLPRSIAMGFLKISQITTSEWYSLTQNDNSKAIEQLILNYKKCPSWYYNCLLAKNTRSQDRQKEFALALCRLANVDTSYKMSVHDIPAFEDVLDVQICVVSSTVGNKFIRPLPQDTIQDENEPEIQGETKHNRIFLYHTEIGDNTHFHTIANICGFFSNAKFCQQCLKPYNNCHQCALSCFVCKRSSCLDIPDENVSCLDCYMTCRSYNCFEVHRQVHGKAKESSCQKWWKCITCKKVSNRHKRSPEDHTCGEYECHSCQRFVDENHLCYMRAKDCKESKPRYIFFDFEATQQEVLECADGYLAQKRDGCTTCSGDSPVCKECTVCHNCRKSWCGQKQHKVNLVVAHKVCEECIHHEQITPESKCDNCGTRCKQCNEIDKKDKCFVRPPCKETCGFRETVFRGEDTNNLFGSWLFSKHHKGFTAIAHNMKGYDGYFLLQYLIANSIIPKIIYAGSKIMFLQVHRGLNIRILDSLNFLPMKLAQLPRAFGLKELKKGYFPHFFNRIENQDYVGKYPPVDMYGYDTMSCKDREDFLMWYKQKEENADMFDFKQEILEYCRSDVDILRQACLKFRDILMTITGKEEVVFEDDLPDKRNVGGVDPFTYITIAGVCLAVYKNKFLQENWKVKLRQEGNALDWSPARRENGELSVYFQNEWMTGTQLQSHDVLIEDSQFVSSPISQIPTQGYGPFLGQYSRASIQWLSWIEEEHFSRTGTRIQIRHALSENGEMRLPGTRYLLDGYCDELSTAYEFLGCFWHGCRECYPNQRRQLKNTRTNQSMEELYALTLQKQKYIESLGMKYVQIWEHEFKKLLSNNETVSTFLDSLDIQERLNPRDAFFGGRTNAVKLHYKVTDGEKIHYLDFCSLYPSVNKYAKYPVKQPNIITTNFKDIRNYFGIAKLKILPPRKLYHPVLPQKINGKLTFSLCKTCAEKQSQTPCKCTDDDRAFVGTFCTPEIEKAVECGYVILKIYEIYHWDETSQYDATTDSGGIFGQYINLFLKIKQEASGWPDWVQSEDDAVRYVGEYALREGIELDRSKITKNPALRSIAKLLLNSFWGKFGQRLNMPQTTFFHETEADKFFQYVSDSKELKDFNIVSRDMIQVSWEYKGLSAKEDFQTNIFIAAFTTCWARLKLYKLLQFLSERVIYMDTDSVIYVSKEGQPEPEVGSFLGQLTNELNPGEHITEFVSGGPKNYAYRTSEGRDVCKVKGFSLNYRNSKLLNFDSMLELVTRPGVNPEKRHIGKRKRTDQSLVLVNPCKINRHKSKATIFTREEKKEYNIVYTKRVIQDNFDTLPYGY